MHKLDTITPTTTLNVTFWGVRGSLAAPGTSTQRYGGNTSCVEVSSEQTTLVFDAGTGIRAAGAAIQKRRPRPIHLFFSHLHWDHIQGFPFFAPAYTPNNDVNIYGPLPVEELRASLERQMRPPNFPVRFEDLKSRIIFHEVRPQTPISIGDLEVLAVPLNHPGGVMAYRVQASSGGVVYSTDHEHGTEADDRLVELARDADLLIYDAMYTPEEYSGRVGTSKRGWGHSTYEQAAAVAQRANAARLVLFHHDPERSDEQVDQIVERASLLHPDVIAAREGLVLVAGEDRRHAA